MRRAARLAVLIAVPAAILAGLVAYGGLGGFHSAGSGPSARATATGLGADAVVAVPSVSLAPSPATMCLAFIAALPTGLDGLAERRVSRGAEQNAAFGEPPIVVHCGAARATYAPTDEVYLLSGVCWHEAAASGATVWTTLDRLVPVAVTVPSSYAQPGQWVARFSGPLISAMPSISNVPPGCTG